MTRRRNQARRSRSARATARTRAHAEAGQLETIGLQAQRAADAAIGGTVLAGEAVADAVRPLSSRREAERRVARARRRVGTQLRKAERRGATIRRRGRRRIESLV